MATLSIRARRTKKNRFPLSQAPLAIWRKNDWRVALRADGSIVVNVAGSGWMLAKWPEMNAKGNSAESVEAFLRERGQFERERAS